MRKLLCILLIGCAMLAACQRGSEREREREEIVKALKLYVDQQPGFEQGTADRAVRSLNVDRDHAEVVVEFKSRTDGTIRLMQYHVQREAAVWTVKSAKPFTPRPV